MFGNLRRSMLIVDLTPYTQRISEEEMACTARDSTLQDCYCKGFIRSLAALTELREDRSFGKPDHCNVGRPEDR